MNCSGIYLQKAARRRQSARGSPNFARQDGRCASKALLEQRDGEEGEFRILFDPKQFRKEHPDLSLVEWKLT